jgi:hypothetical protein
MAAGLITDGSNDYKYGSVGGTGDEAEAHNDFNEADLLFYKDREPSKQEKMIKTLKIAIPLIIAVSLIGGFAWFLLQDFGFFYPGPATESHNPEHTPGGSGSSTLPASTTAPRAPTVPAGAPKGQPPGYDSSSHSATSSSGSSSTVVSASSSASRGGSSSCAANSKCSALGLTGECCPTSGGTMLDCC